MPLLNAIFSNPAVCNFEGPKYLLFSGNVTPLIYYSHIPVTIFSLILGFFVFFNDRKKLPNKILFCLTLAFSSWVFLDSVFWASNRSDVIMFVWSLQILFEPLVYMAALYLLYVLVKKEDIPFNQKIIIALIYLPIIVFVPTRFSLSAFNTSTCLSKEGPVAIYYTYAAEILYALWLIGFAVKEIAKAKTKEFRQEIIMLTGGIILLLVAFSFGNIISSFTENWEFAQIGLFAMPVFIGILVYGIVRFKTFNIKIIGAQALVVALVGLIGAQFFYIQNPTNKILNAVAMTISVVFGYLLVRSVKREVEQREKLEVLTAQLEDANEELKKLDAAKSEFISIASHQLRAPMTVIKGYVSLILEGSIGKIESATRDALGKVSVATEHLIQLISDLLDLSRIESGKIKYTFAENDLVKEVEEVVQSYSNSSRQKGLDFKFQNLVGEMLKFSFDKDKIHEVVVNLIDNAVKYSKKGGHIMVKLEKTGDKARYSVQDDGIGVKPEDRKKLFTKFARATNAQLADPGGMGIGLYFVKRVVEDHKGAVGVQSEGEGKGSTFWVELPLH